MFRSPRWRLALRLALSTWWIGVGTAKLLAPSLLAFGQFLGSIVVLDGSLQEGAYFAVAIAECSIGALLLLRSSLRWPLAASFFAASIFLIVQALLGVDSDCACFGAVAVPWVLRLVALATVTTISYVLLASTAARPIRGRNVTLDDSVAADGT